MVEYVEEGKGEGERQNFSQAGGFRTCGRNQSADKKRPALSAAKSAVKPQGILICLGKISRESDLPNLLRVLRNRAVGGELACAGDVHQALAREGQLVAVVAVDRQLRVT